MCFQSKRKTFLVMVTSPENSFDDMCSLWLLLKQIIFSASELTVLWGKLRRDLIYFALHRKIVTMTNIFIRYKIRWDNFALDNSSFGGSSTVWQVSCTIWHSYCSEFYFPKNYLKSTLSSCSFGGTIYFKWGCLK